MHVFHPPQTNNGLPPENVFVVADSANMPVAEGYLIPSYHPYLFPERPLNYYISLRSRGPGKDMALGAVLGRVQQLRNQNPHLAARAFAQVSPQDTALLGFYMESGFDCNDRLDIVSICPPNAKPSAPMGYDMNRVPFENQAQINGFLQRMNTYRLNAWRPEQLQRFMSTPNFLALYISRGQELVGEIAFAGEGSNAMLLGMYVVPNYRRMGMAKHMIAAGMKMLSDYGVNYVEAEVIYRNEIQGRLAQSCNATFVRTEWFYPGINYD